MQPSQVVLTNKSIYRKAKKKNKYLDIPSEKNEYYLLFTFSKHRSISDFMIFVNILKDARFNTKNYSDSGFSSTGLRTLRLKSCEVSKSNPIFLFLTDKLTNHVSDIPLSIQIEIKPSFYVNKDYIVRFYGYLFGSKCRK